MSGDQYSLFKPLFAICKTPVTASFKSSDPHFEQKMSNLATTREISEKKSKKVQLSSLNSAQTFISQALKMFENYGSLGLTFPPKSF